MKGGSLSSSPWGGSCAARPAALMRADTEPTCPPPVPSWLLAGLQGGMKTRTGTCTTGRWLRHNCRVCPNWRSKAAAGRLRYRTGHNDLTHLPGRPAQHLAVQIKLSEIGHYRWGLTSSPATATHSPSDAHFETRGPSSA